nr:NACHT domain-containing protein [Micromonospora kangleipakensis]
MGDHRHRRDTRRLDHLLAVPSSAPSTPNATGDADKVWRRLWLENRIMVLADGLEEVLADTAQPADRDSLLREAVRAAVRERLPLLVASRPDAPLRGLDALLLQLEPFAPGAALEYVQTRSHRSDPGQWRDHIAQMIKAAGVADSPFHLRVIGQLHEVDRLDRMAGDRGRFTVGGWLRTASRSPPTRCAGR